MLQRLRKNHGVQPDQPLFPFDLGEIYFKGKRIDTVPAHKICEMGIGRTFQVVKPLRRMSVIENVMAGAFLRTSSMGESQRHKAEEIIEFCGLEKVYPREAKGLPIPLRKRLEICQGPGPTSRPCSCWTRPVRA